jgi:hypothetical protein
MSSIAKSNILLNKKRLIKSTISFIAFFKNEWVSVLKSEFKIVNNKIELKNNEEAPSV